MPPGALRGALALALARSLAPLAVGQSVNGRDIWVAKIGARGPSVFLGGNIHGDETTGGQLLQRWLWETCNQPSREQIEVAGTTIVR